MNTLKATFRAIALYIVTSACISVHADDSTSPTIGPGERLDSRILGAIRTVADAINPANWAVIGIDAATKGLTGKHLYELRPSTNPSDCTEGAKCNQDLLKAAENDLRLAIEDTPCANTSMLGMSKVSADTMRYEQHLRANEQSRGCVQQLEANIKLRIPDAIIVID